MHYHVSRNGQMYGPYTLDDLNRYVASGNVLKTDMVKSEEMTDWISVAQLMQQQAGNPFSAPAAWAANASQPATETTPAGSMPTQSAPILDNAASTQPGGFTTPLISDPAQQQPGYLPQQNYAPQQAVGYGAPAVNASQYPDAPNLHWGLVLLFSVFTCGLFSYIWVLIQTAWLRRVQPNSNALLFYIGELVLVFASWVLQFQRGFGMAARANASPTLSILIGLVTLAIGVISIAARFVERANLEEHFNGPEPVGLQLSGVMTFFFGMYYFQYHLNRINAMKQAARYGSVPRPY